MRRFVLLSAAFLGLASMVGCGAGDSETASRSNEAEVRTTVERLYAAMRADDAVATCRLLTPEARKSTRLIDPLHPSHRGCRRSLKQFFADVRRNGRVLSASAVRIKTVRSEGRTATVRVVVSGRTIEIPLVVEDGDWRISSLGTAKGR